MRCSWTARKKQPLPEGKKKKVTARTLTRQVSQTAFPGSGRTGRQKLEKRNPCFQGKKRPRSGDLRPKKNGALGVRVSNNVQKRSAGVGDLGVDTGEETRTLYARKQKKNSTERKNGTVLPSERSPPKNQNGGGVAEEEFYRAPHPMSTGNGPRWRDLGGTIIEGGQKKQPGSCRREKGNRRQKRKPGVLANSQGGKNSRGGKDTASFVHWRKGENGNVGKRGMEKEDPDPARVSPSQKTGKFWQGEQAAGDQGNRARIARVSAAKAQTHETEWGADGKEDPTGRPD